MTKPAEFKTQFAEDVFHGLTEYPKTLKSKYFYDKIGDELFQKIMGLPEYYLTETELKILNDQKQQIASAFNAPGGFDLIELGAGDGKKTKVLLKHFQEKGFHMKYLPVDISSNVLEQLTMSLKKEIPSLEVAPIRGMYKNVLQQLSDYKERKKVIMLLGSNIGNLTQEEAIQFLKKITGAMTQNDLFFMGVDQKKDPQLILNAYNDSQGITEAFNKNLLTRINRELDANFDVNAFQHWPTYDPETGLAKSFLVSTKEQCVQINSLNLEVLFQQWESIHTEISQKYDDTSVGWLANEAGLKIKASFSDKDNYYKNYIFIKS